MSWTQETINEVYAKVMQKATTDEEFREELLNNPNKTIEKLTGEKLPDDFKVKILENDPNYTATFVLPNMRSTDLNIDDLENVAGGFGGCTAEFGEIGDVNVNACGNQVGGNQTKQ
ncbi:MAG: NHLP leader peptide family RiPP precursor [Streptococcaceae bacterium]|jgi:hypothetical protein|nr:NHLP leader peptide family RiPP precursor [Streptococcaceae bacterium]